jgi:F-type H+-transporting ATPase subunit gamma
MSELGELVGALRSMSASRAREAQEALEGTRSYCEVVERAIAEVSLLLPDGAEAAEKPKSAALLVLTSENGFVGPFSSHLIERALDERAPEEKLIICGRRGVVALSERGVADAISFPMTSRVQGVTTLARRIASELSECAAARVVFAKRLPGAAFETSVRTVLPLGKTLDISKDTLPVVHVPPGELLALLALEYLFAEIAHCLMESLACENAARMRAMDSASRNIEENVDALRSEERAARQEKTTTEMLDVVTGAEAVNHE